MKRLFDDRCGGSCLQVLIIIALIAILGVVVSRLMSAEKQLADNEQPKPVEIEKTPEELRRDRINEELAGEAPDLGSDPSEALVDGHLMTMKSVREKTVQRQAVIKSRLKSAEETFDRLRGERKQLERKLERLKEEFDRFPDDDNVGDDLAQCDEDLENKQSEILQAQADVNLLKDYDYRMGREVAVLSAAIRQCEMDRRTTITGSEYELLKKDLSEAHGAEIAVRQARRNHDGQTTEIAAGASGEKLRKRERLEKYRKPKPQENEEK